MNTVFSQHILHLAVLQPDGQDTQAAKLYDTESEDCVWCAGGIAFRSVRRQLRNTFPRAS